MNKYLQSSANPENLSLTIKGILVALVPIIIAVLQAFDLHFSEVEVMEIIQQLTVILAQVMIALGLVRKLWFYFKK